MQGPGARLELQLAVLDLERLRARLLALELGEELPRLVLGGDEPERAGDENREQAEVQLDHASGSIRSGDGCARSDHAGRSATRMTALRARGLAVHFRSRRDGPARPTSLSRGCGISLAFTGSRSGNVGRAASRRKRFTMRSSSEWKLITASRPPGASAATRLGQRQRQFLKLLIDVNPYSLKGARRRILARSRVRTAAATTRGKLPGACDRLARASSNNRLCNRSSKPFFAIVS